MILIKDQRNSFRNNVNVRPEGMNYRTDENLQVASEDRLLSHEEKHLDIRPTAGLSLYLTVCLLFVV